VRARRRDGFVVQGQPGRSSFGQRSLGTVAPKQQASFVREIARVVHKWALIAVPDRLCPVEIHSRMPLLHWLPCWRAIVRGVGEVYWASPSNMTSLFTRVFLLSLLDSETWGADSWQLTHQRFCGIPVSICVRHERNEDRALELLLEA